MGGVSRDATTSALGLAYNDLVRERDRLRDARRSVTSALGPLPAASAVAVGLFGLSNQELHDWTFGLYVAVLVLFAFMSFAGWRAIRQNSYRELRHAYVRDLSGSNEDDSEEWLRTMIDLERNLYTKLETSFEKERWWMLAMQWTAVAQIVLLGAITLIGS